MLQRPQRPNARQQRVSGDEVWPAPVEGWDASTSLAAMDKKRAVSLVNWFPQPGYIEIRKGSDVHATGVGEDGSVVTANDVTNILEITPNPFADDDVVAIIVADDSGSFGGDIYYVMNSTGTGFQITRDEPDGPQTPVDFDPVTGTVVAYRIGVWNADFAAIEPRGAPVETLIPYEIANITSGGKLFAAGGGAIWDVTGSGFARPTFSGFGPFASDRWQYTNFATPTPTNYIILVNGLDTPLAYDGSAWSQLGITVKAGSETFDPDTFINVTAHKGRLWFVPDNSSNAVYLDVPFGIQGEGVAFPLGPYFTKGGRLQEIISWTRDGGAGPDDYLVFLSNKGQAVIYAGIDPSSATDWVLVGVFDVGEPIGERCVVSYGPNPLLITTSGLLQLNLAFGEREASLEATSHTARIYRAITEVAALNQGQFGWECVQFPDGNKLVLNIPFGGTSVQYVQNTLTGAWCQFRGWPALTMAVFENKLYYGDRQGRVVQADVGSNDRGNSIVATGETSYSSFGTVGRKKQFKLVQAMTLADGVRRPSLGMSVDFGSTTDLSSQFQEVAATTRWNNDANTASDMLWNSSEWASGAKPLIDWTSPRQLGTWGSVKFELSTSAGGGGDKWDVGKWDLALWGSGGGTEETAEINGFVVVYELGEFL